MLVFFVLVVGLALAADKSRWLLPVAAVSVFVVWPLYNMLS